KIGLTTTFYLDNAGSVDVKYPVNPHVKFPDANSFRAGDTVQIETWSTDEPGYKLSSVSPQFRLTVDGTFRLFAQADAKACVFDCFATDDLLPANLKPRIDIGSDNPFNIFTVTQNSGIATPPWFGLV